MGWWEWDVANNRHHWSPEFERLLGLEPGSFRGGIEAFLERVYPDDRARVEALVRGDGGQNRPPTFEYRVPLPGGGVRWVESRAQVYRDQSGSVLRLLGLDLDITERKRAEEQLLNAKARQALLLKLSDALRPLSNPGEIQAAAARTAMEYFGADHCYYCEVVDDEALIRQDTARADLPSVVRTYPLSDFPVFKMVLEAGHPLVVCDAHTTKVLDENLRQLCLRLQIVSFVDVPVIKDRKPVGVFCVTQSTPRQWTGLEVELAEEIAERTWAAVERGRAEQALRESEERYRSLFTSIDQGFCIFEMIFDKRGQPVDYRFLEVNPAFENQTGLKDAVGRTARELVPDLEPHWLEIYSRVALTGEAVRFSQGSETMGRWFDVYAFRPGGAESRRVALLLSDITGQREREAQLSASERRYRALVQATAMAVWRNLGTHGDDPETQVWWAALTGQNPEKAAGWGWLEQVHPDDRERAREAWSSALEHSTFFETEYRVHQKEGGYVHLEVRGVPILGDDGKAREWIGTFADITSRKQTEERLAALVRVTSSLTATQTLAEVRQVMLGEVLDALGANGGGLRLLTSQGLVLEESVLGTHAREETVQPFTLIRLDADHPAAEAVRSSKPLFYHDPAEILQQYPQLEATIQQLHLGGNAHLPLQRGSETFGVISLSFPTPKTWDEDERSFALALADRIAVAYERARLFEEARLGEDRAVQLQALTVLLSAAPTPAEAVSLVFQYGLFAVGASAGTVALLSADGESLEVLGASGDPPELVERFRRYPLSLPTPLATAVRRGEAEWVGSPQAFAQRYGHPPETGGSAAWVALPLLAHGKPVGGLELTYTQPRAFDPGEQTFLLTLAEVCAGALERSRLFEAERFARERAETLQRVAATLAATSTPQEVAEAVTREGSLALGARHSGLYLAEGELLHREDRGDTGSELRQRYAEVPLRALIPAAEAVRDEEPRWIRSREDFLHQYPHLETELDLLGAEAAVSLPVRMGGRVAGSLNFIFDRGVEWNEGERSFVKTLAALAGQALERTRLFASLTESEERFRQLAETIPQLAWMADASGHIFWYNRRWYEYTGTTPEEMEGWGWQKVHDPEALPRVLERWQVSLKSGEPFDMTFPLRGADGVFRPFLTRVEPLKDAAGRVSRWFGTNTDVTEQLEAEARQAYLVRLSDALRPLSDPAEVLVEAARLLGETLGVSRAFYAEVEPDGDHVTIRRDYHSGLPSAAGRYRITDFGLGLAEALRAGGTVAVEDIEQDLGVDAERRAAYAAIGVQAHATIPLVRGGRLVALLGLHHASPRRWAPGDLALLKETAERTWAALERARAEAALRESEEKYRTLAESQKRFVADAAHELRAPLTAIQGNLDLLERFKDMTTEDRDEAISEAAREAGRLARLVNDLLALARGDAGARVRHEPLHLEAVLREAFTSAQGFAKGHTLKLGELGSAQVQGDPDRLKELFLILLDNALKYTPPTGYVRLSCAVQDGVVEVRVEDSGVGIAPEDLPQVFERFYRADHARTPGSDPGGTGLGLSIAQWIVGQHGGTIHLESELGQGTVAVVRLPLAPVDQASAKTG
jgi:PAS domain S-box-containing protein